MLLKDTVKLMYSNTTFVKVKFITFLYVAFRLSIQIQHLLKLNERYLSRYIRKSLIQIQHLLKLNSRNDWGNHYIQDSNTTFVKVK